MILVFCINTTELRLVENKCPFMSYFRRVEHGSGHRTKRGGWALTGKHPTSGKRA